MFSSTRWGGFRGNSRPVDGLDLSLGKLVSASRALSVSALETLGEALLAEHVEAALDDHFLLSSSANGAK